MVKTNVSASGKQYYKTICRPCHNRESKIVQTLHKLHKQPVSGSPCHCCGRIDRLFLDHDHVSGAYRGWLCRQCNLSLGLLGDSAQGVRQALTYLERAEINAIVSISEYDGIGPIDDGLSSSAESSMQGGSGAETTGSGPETGSSSTENCNKKS